MCQKKTRLKNKNNETCIGYHKSGLGIQETV